ncbi:hypothetical protein BP00DRAFT_22993 [Aspergillus indologenus CBS 114.80]|uniref:Uncharacterized protein n=1 Tax=Aspergillus indologenus CBS 114.80 TaxID=1450541 RepID=A0A2V5HSC2_9EURO|nr:hypothetical protein BP00DRAFT_22993 [Aspergillus indologenus CBS 114.80]
MEVFVLMVMAMVMVMVLLMERKKERKKDPASFGVVSTFSSILKTCQEKLPIICPSLLLSLPVCVFLFFLFFKVIPFPPLFFFCSSSVFSSSVSLFLHSIPLHQFQFHPVFLLYTTLSPGCARFRLPL